MKKGKKIAVVLGILVAIDIGWIAFCGYFWSWGPFAKLYQRKMRNLPGNSPQYNLEQVGKKKDCVLEEKNIIFLGSSVTYGASSQGVSFVDYLEKQTGCYAVKEAVSGTTLVDEAENSYIKRMEKMDVEDIDLFICQLSTNDASQKKELGKMSTSTDFKEFDTGSIAGSIEYIIAYVKNRWNCPVLFFTNPQYNSKEYGKMVSMLKEIQKKWGIGIIDMWNDESFNALSEEERKLYMADSIHPTKAGYLEWWLPYMENKIEDSLKNVNEIDK